MIEPTADKWALLTRPFEADEVNLLPKGKGSGDDINCEVCGGRHKARGIFHVPYVGHARVTARLNEVDPSWIMIPGELQYPDKELVWMPVALTVLGITKHEVGCTSLDNDEWPKQLMSDALTRAAMRFGVALDLWMKIPPAQENRSRNRSQPAQQAAAAASTVERDPDLEALLALLQEDVGHLDMVGLAAWSTWKANHPKWWLSVDLLVEGRNVVMELLVPIPLTPAGAVEEPNGYPQAADDGLDGTEPY